MALITNPNLWGGEYVQGVNTAAVLGGDTVQAGLWRLEEGFEDKAIIKTFDYASRLAVGTLCTITSGDSASMADISINLTTFSIFDKVCKDDFSNTNYAMFQQKGVMNKSIPTEVLEAYISSMAGAETFNLENLRWSGDVLSGNPLLALQDGIIKQAVTAGTFVPVAAPTIAAITNPATVIAELQKVIGATPARVRMQPNYKLVVSTAIFMAYEQAIAANTALATWNMGMTVAMQNEPIFVGYFAGTKVPMYVATGLDAGYPGVALAGNFSNDIKGNLVFVTDAISDQASIVVQDRQAIFASEPFIDITWSFRQGMRIVRYGEVVIYLGV